MGMTLKNQEGGFFSGCSLRKVLKITKLLITIILIEDHHGIGKRGKKFRPGHGLKDGLAFFD